MKKRLILSALTVLTCASLAQDYNAAASLARSNILAALARARERANTSPLPWKPGDPIPESTTLDSPTVASPMDSGPQPAYPTAATILYKTAATGCSALGGDGTLMYDIVGYPPVAYAFDSTQIPHDGGANTYWNPKWWSNILDDYSFIQSVPVIGPEGYLYISSRSSYAPCFLNAFDTNGAALWSCADPDGPSGFVGPAGDPALDYNDNLYLGKGASVFCVSNGLIQWSFSYPTNNPDISTNTPIGLDSSAWGFTSSSPVIGADGTVYANSDLEMDPKIRTSS